MKQMKWLLFILVITVSLGGCASVNNGGLRSSCENAIFSARIKRISLPLDAKIDHFAISRDSQSIVFLLTVFEGGIYKATDPRMKKEHKLYLDPPGVYITNEEALKLVRQWHQERQNPEWQITESRFYPYPKVVHMEFYTYDLGSGKWEKLPWEEGKKALKADVKIKDSEGASPDGMKFLEKEVLTIKTVSVMFIPTDGEFQKYKLIVQCKAGQGRILGKGWEYRGEPFTYRWSPDSKYAVIQEKRVDANKNRIISRNNILIVIF